MKKKENGIIVPYSPPQEVKSRELFLAKHHHTSPSPLVFHGGLANAREIDARRGKDSFESDRKSFVLSTSEWSERLLAKVKWALAGPYIQLWKKEPKNKKNRFPKDVGI